MNNLMSYQVSDRLPIKVWAPNHLQIRQYSEVSGDFNPIHLDDNYAIRAGLGGVIAHGMLTMAHMAAMLTEWIGQEGNILMLNVRFEQMVRPGNKITFYGIISERVEKTLVCNLEARNENEEKVISGLAKISINN